MSDFVSHDMLPDLWEEILRRHWTFLETEECIQKLEERKKLEGCLKEFLCIVPHDRKFFLPETGIVLRKSIREMSEFTAHKAIIGFEAVSQYANNLFTKPWRKEFRVLKTYSGVFQHEIKTNLVDADKMFEAMGYRRISDEVFVLDGPICPDQVTNVSRDAMAAYVECQIIKYIFAGLIAIGLNCTWLDIYNYRERHVGGTTQAIKEIAYALQEKRLRKEKHLATENTYGNIQTTLLPQLGAANQCNNCAPYHQSTKSHHMQSSATCAVHNTNNNCVLHPNVAQTNLMYNGNGMRDANKLIASYPAPAYQHHAFVAPGQATQQQQAQMTHSRSLEHYNEPHAYTLPHRHSFDHQQQGCTAHHQQQPMPPHGHVYEAPYDSLDGVSMGSSTSYAAIAAGNGGAGYKNAYAHPYNAPGNRYPLPYNISNQLNTQYSTPNISCNGIKCGEQFMNVDKNSYGTIGKAHNCNYYAQQQPASATTLRHNVASNLPENMSGAATMQYRQCSFPPDQLIDFDDRAPLTKHDYHAQMLPASSLDYDREQRMYDRRPVIQSNVNPAYVQPKDHLYTHEPASGMAQTTANEAYIYSRPLPKTSRTNRQQVYNMADKMNQDYVDNNRKKQHELKETQRPSTSVGGSRRKLSTGTRERDTMSDLTSYESASLEDFAHIGHSEHLLPSPTLISKNQDGVGSFESWNYVFQNLERSGYSKDLGDREDLLVQSLDLDSLTLANGLAGNADKRRSTQIDTKSNRLSDGLEKSRTLEKTPTSSKREIKSSTLKPEKTTSKSILPANNVGTSGRKMKSALKNTNSENKSEINTNQTVQRSRSVAIKQPPPVSTQLIVTSPNEWSCHFCTFLNPDTKRICEMCCRTKESNVGVSNLSHASTCV